jgi:PnrA-like ABC transporter substrate-binding protein
LRRRRRGNGGSSGTQAKKLKVALVMSGPINDKGFNQTAYSGLQGCEQAGAQTAYAESVKPANYVKTWQSFARANDVVMGAGFEYGDVAKQVAPEFSNVKFVVTANPLKPSQPNIMHSIINSTQGAYLAGRDGDDGGDGVRGGTLRVLTAEPNPTLDTAVFYYPPIARAYARTLYGYNLAGPPEQKIVPVPDIADGPAQLSADRRSYTFRLRAGVRYAPRSTARSPPETSSPPSSGSTTNRPPRAGTSSPTSSPGPKRSAPARPTASRA